MYSNDYFMNLKSKLENGIVEQTKLEVERKHLLKDFDSAISDLNLWKEERARKQQRQIPLKQVAKVIEDEEEDPMLILAQQ